MRSVAEARWIDWPEPLPPEAVALFARPDSGLDVGRFYDTWAWFDLACRTTQPDAAHPTFLLVSRADVVLAVLPLWRFSDGRLESMTSPYSCLHHPLLAADVDDAATHAIGKAVARAIRGAPSLRLECLDADWPPLAAFWSGLRAGGLMPLRFEHFGNWHAEISIDGYSGGWAFYLASRSGALRETIRRRGAKISRDGAFVFEIVTGGARLEAAIAGFESVYAKSWKTAEPHAAFNAEMMRLLASMGLLRLAVLWHGQTPAAAQYWLLAGRQAQVLKLAHDPAFDAFSPGTVLTAWTIAALLDKEGVNELDFGRGDDDYKQLWVERRRVRIGLLAANPRRWAGGVLIVRHLLGGLRRALLPK